MSDKRVAIVKYRFIPSYCDFYAVRYMIVSKSDAQNIDREDLIEIVWNPTKEQIEHATAESEMTNLCMKNI